MITHTNMTNVSLSFFRLQNKRCLKLLGKIIVSACIICMVLLGMAMVVGKILTENAIIEKVQVAVVIPEEESVVKMAAKYASTIESVDEICDFNYYNDEDNAMQDLKEGKMQVCIFFSTDFYNQVNSEYGVIQKVYVNDKSSLSFSLFQNMLEDGIRLLQTSAAGIYSACDTAREFDAPISTKEIDSMLMDIYIDKLFSRTDIFDTEVVSPIGTLSMERYIFFCIFFISMLLPGLYFGGLYKPQSESVEQKLRIYGVTKHRMFVMKTIIFAELIWIVASLTYVFGCVITDLFYLNLVYWDVLVFVKIIPICIILAVVYNSIYTMCRDVKTATVVILLFILWIVVGSGIIVPIDFLPTVLQKIQSILHTTFVNKMILEIIYGNVSNLV